MYTGTWYYNDKQVIRMDRKGKVVKNIVKYIIGKIEYLNIYNVR